MPTRTISTIASGLCVCLLSMPGQATADLITDALSGMSANSWQKLNINTFESVWTPLAQRPTTASPGSNISAWSGAAWDSRRNNLLIWGGDIGNEEGNEVYIFSGKTGLWSRGALPSQITSTGGITSGQPRCLSRCSRRRDVAEQGQAHGWAGPRTRYVSLRQCGREGCCLCDGLV